MGLMDFFGSPIFGAIADYGVNQDYWRRYDQQAEQAQERLNQADRLVYDEYQRNMPLMSDYATGRAGAWGGYAAGVPGAYGAMASPILGGYGQRTAAGLATGGNILNRAQDFFDTALMKGEDIIGGYENRYATGMGMLEGAGEQQRRDIDAAYRAAAAGGAQQLAAQGLAGTTIAPTMAMGYERERLGEQGRLQEALRQEQLAAHTGLSGDTLAARQAQQGVALGAGQNLLGTMGAQQAFAAGLSGEQLGAQMDLGLTGFDYGQVAQLAALQAGDVFGMMPMQYDIDWRNRAINQLGAVTYGFPQQPSGVNYSSYVTPIL